jgi:hypothetical protein
MKFLNGLCNKHGDCPEFSNKVLQSKGIQERLRLNHGTNYFRDSNKAIIFKSIQWCNEMSIAYFRLNKTLLHNLVIRFEISQHSWNLTGY